MTYRIAHSIGTDAADRQMRQNGRTVWNDDDYNLAAITLNTHFSLRREYPGTDPTLCDCSQSHPVQQQLLFGK